jgi:hypothetical protein
MLSFAGVRLTGYAIDSILVAVVYIGGVGLLYGLRAAP